MTGHAAGTSRRSMATLLAWLSITALLAGCATAPAKVTVGGETRLSPLLFEPAASNATGEPELAFCVDGLPQSLELFRRRAPFRRIAPVDSGASCDVRLNLVWVYASGNGTVVATSMDDGTELLSAEAEGVWGPTFGVERLGPIVYNAFIPGSLLYRKVTDARRAEEAAWREALRRYREAPVKPMLPEEARRFKVQAEAALAQKEFAESAGFYKEALKAAPWWPEGHFNRALILGETARYAEAIGEMRKYLALVPEAPDARASQDKIYEWERLAGKGGAPAPADASPAPSKPARTKPARTKPDLTR